MTRVQWVVGWLVACGIVAAALGALATNMTDDVIVVGVLALVASAVFGAGLWHSDYWGLVPMVFAPTMVAFVLVFDESGSPIIWGFVLLALACLFAVSVVGSAVGAFVSYVASRGRRLTH